MLFYETAERRPRTFSEIREAEDPDGKNHDLRLVCVSCGTVQTCRCSKPKRTFFGICSECDGGDVLDESLSPGAFFKPKSYSEKVKDAVLGIIMEERKISEKAYDAIDFIQADLKALWERSGEELAEIVGRFEEGGLRVQFCAESIYSRLEEKDE